jgi:hypothetical protein
MSGIDGTKNNSATKVQSLQSSNEISCKTTDEKFPFHSLQAVFAFAREFHSKKVNQKPISYGTAGFRTQ